MNPLIDLVSLNVIYIDREQCDWIKLTIHHNGMLYIHAGGDVVVSGPRRDALIDALQCLRDTGSFAALSDESAVPYVGKRMRLSLYAGSNYTPVVVISHFENHSPWVKWHNDRCDAPFSVDRNRLIPLTPAPKWRPFTPAEALQHLGRSFNDNVRGIGPQTIEYVGAEEVRCHSGTVYELAEFATGCTWADTGEPCGKEDGP